MKKIDLTFFIKIIFLVSIYSCSTNQKFDYKPLNSFKNDTSLIQQNEEVKILAFSGSIDKNLDAIYYSQVLVTKNNSGDTFAILCPTLKVPAPNNSGEFDMISPTKFDPEKRIYNASYERLDSFTQIALQVADEAMNKKLDNIPLGKPVDINFNMPKKELVAINKTLPIFKKEYKTVIGILKFFKDVGK